MVEAPDEGRSLVGPPTPRFLLASAARTAYRNRWLLLQRTRRFELGRVFLDLDLMIGTSRRHGNAVRLTPPEGFRGRIGLGDVRLKGAQAFVVVDQCCHHRKNYSHEHRSEHDKSAPVEPRGPRL
jgi:hypothetical protein